MNRLNTYARHPTMQIDVRHMFGGAHPADRVIIVWPHVTVRNNMPWIGMLVGNGDLQGRDPYHKWILVVINRKGKPVTLDLNKTWIENGFVPGTPGSPIVYRVRPTMWNHAAAA
jgi:hypothetical protein